MELRSRNCNENGNGQCNSSEERKHLKTGESDNWLNLRGVAENCSTCFLLGTIYILKMDPRGHKRSAKSELRRVGLICFSRKDRVRGMRAMVHCEGLEVTGVSESAISTCNRDEHVEMVRNVLFSQEDVISPAIAMTTEEEGKGTVGYTLGKRREKCSVFTMSLEMELGKVREKHSSVAAVPTKYKVLEKNLDKK